MGTREDTPHVHNIKFTNGETINSMLVTVINMLHTEIQKHSNEQFTSNGVTTLGLEDKGLTHRTDNSAGAFLQSRQHSFAIIKSLTDSKHLNFYTSDG